MRMQHTILFCIVLVAALLSWGLGLLPQTSTAVAAPTSAIVPGHYTVTATETLQFNEAIGFVSVEAVTDSVYFRILGAYLVDNPGNGRLAVPAGLVNKWNGYLSGRRTLFIAVYPVSGATAEVEAW